MKILRHHDHSEGSGHAHEHEHTHTHTHADGTVHEHAHGHGHEGDTADKTLMLLGYLYDHNVHHASELDDLAEKLKAEGRGEAAEKVLAAKECFGSGNALLHEAIHMCE